MEEYILQYFHVPSKEQLNSSLYITWSGNRKCTPEHVIGPRMLDTYKVVFVISGKGYLRQSDHQTFRLSSGDMFVLFPRELHHYYTDPDDPWELMWVAFNGHMCSEILSGISITIDHYIVMNALTSTIKSSLANIIGALGDTDDINRLRAIGNLYILFSQIGKAQESNDKLIDRFKQEDSIWKAVTFIEQNYYMHIDVEMLCKHINYSRSYLSREFKSHMGVTIPEYISKLRVQNAKLLLGETELSIQEIAYSVGIEDSFYFSKLFKKITGYSPLAYRKQVILNTN